MIREFDQFLLAGSELLLVTDEPGAKDCLDARVRRHLQHAARSPRGAATDRATLESIGIDRFDHVMVLAADGLDPQRADARTLVTLLHLRDIAERQGAKFSIVSEMLDERNRQLAEVTKVDDVIVSDKIISLMLTQISENRELAAGLQRAVRGRGRRDLPAAG